MRRLLFPALAACVVAVSACGTGSPTVSTFERIPTAVAFDWLNAVSAAEGDSIAAVVEPHGLVIVAAAENNYSMEQTASLLQSGFTEGLAANYWQSVREEFSGFAGVPFRDLEVGVYEEFDSGAERYAVVTLRSPGGDGSLVTSSGADGWKVDMAATVGPAFAAQIRTIAEGLDDTASSALIAQALREAVLPGLAAAAVLDPDNGDLAREIERIRHLVPPAEAG